MSKDSWNSENWKSSRPFTASKSLGRTSSGKSIPSTADDYNQERLYVEGPISANGFDDFNIVPRSGSKWDEWTADDHEDASKAHENAHKKLKSTHVRTNWMDDDPIEMQASHHKGFALMHEWAAKDIKAGIKISAERLDWEDLASEILGDVIPDAMVGIPVSDILDRLMPQLHHPELRKMSKKDVKTKLEKAVSKLLDKKHIKHQ